MHKKFVRACAPLSDDHERDGTIKLTPRRGRAVHYGIAGRPLCVDADGLGWRLTESRKRVTCRRCLRALVAPGRRPDRNPFEWASGLAAAARDMAVERRAREHGPPRLLP